MSTRERTNGRHPLWVPREVDAVPPAVTRPHTSKYKAAYDAILLRLEQTPPGRWLRYDDFTDARDASDKRAVWSKWFERHYGAGYVIMKQRGAALYIGRGAGWHKP